jgi:hypothetical protein
VDLSHAGLGTRTSRYALIIDDLVVKYAEVCTSPVPDLQYRLFYGLTWFSRLSLLVASPSRALMPFSLLFEVYSKKVKKIRKICNRLK